MTNDWRLIRAKGLRDAHQCVSYAFAAQLTWWAYIPFMGIMPMIRRYKLLRIARYLCDQAASLTD